MLAMCLQAAFFTGSGEKSIGRPSSSVDAPLQRALAGGVHPSSRIKLRGNVNVAVRPVGEIRYRPASAQERRTPRGPNFAGSWGSQGSQAPPLRSDGMVEVEQPTIYTAFDLCLHECQFERVQV